MKRVHLTNCPSAHGMAAAAALTAGLAALVMTIPAERAEAKPSLGQHWPPSQRVSIDRIDHAPFDVLLKRYVDPDGYVNYTAWKNSGSDRQALHHYLAELGRADRGKRAARAARLAFWINAYNAVTLEGILQVYPTSSIRNHTARLFGYNIWDDLPLHVGDETNSLNQIEHEILRKMGEPRIHFAIVCASVGCPRLRNEAYRAETLDQQLADNTRDFFSRRKNFYVDSTSRVMHVSSILDWFGSDFGESQAERFHDLSPYLPPSARALAVDPRTTVRYLPYDWSLNDQARKPRTASRR